MVLPSKLLNLSIRYNKRRKFNLTTNSSPPVIAVQAEKVFPVFSFQPVNANVNVVAVAVAVVVEEDSSSSSAGGVLVTGVPGNGRRKNGRNARNLCCKIRWRRLPVQVSQDRRRNLLSLGDPAMALL